MTARLIYDDMNEVVTRKEPKHLKMLEARAALSPERRKQISSNAAKARKAREVEKRQKLKEEFEQMTQEGKKAHIINKVMNEKFEFDESGCSKFEYLFRETYRKVLYSDDLAEGRKFMEFTLNYTGEKPKDQIDITTTSFMRIQQQFMPVALKVVGATEAVNSELIDDDKLLEAEPIGVSDSEAETITEDI